MNHIPADLSPETAAWLQAQMVIQNARTAAILREEINKVDDWSNGIFAALRDALGHLLGEARPIIGDNVTLSPQCGLASVEEGNSIDEATQWKKIDLLVSCESLV